MKMIIETEETDHHGLDAIEVTAYVEGFALQTLSSETMVGHRTPEAVEAMKDRVAKAAGDKKAEVNRSRFRHQLAPELLAMESGCLGRLPEDRR